MKQNLYDTASETIANRAVHSKEQRAKILSMRREVGGAQFDLFLYLHERLAFQSVGVRPL